MKARALLLLLAVSVPTFASDMLPESLDPRISHISEQSNVRVIAYRNCDSKNNCWSDVYLQLVFLEDLKKPIKCSVKIKELEKKYIIKDTRYFLVHGDPQVRLVFSTYDNFKDIKLDYTVATVVPEPDCSYAINFHNNKADY